MFQKEMATTIFSERSNSVDIHVGTPVTYFLDEATEGTEIMEHGGFRILILFKQAENQYCLAQCGAGCEHNSRHTGILGDGEGNRR